MNFELEENKVWDNVSRDYEIEKVLGRGRYGKVVKAKCKLTGKHVAIKLIEDIFSMKDIARGVVRELSILHELS